MKAGKKVVCFVAAAAMAVGMSAFTGCAEVKTGSVSDGLPESYADKVTLIIDDAATEAVDAYFQVDYSVFDEDSTAFDLLEKLKEGGKICFRSQDSVYGAFLEAAGIIRDGKEEYLIEADDSAQLFIAIYTNVEKDMAGPNSIRFGNETVESSAVGISSMSLKNGAIICLTEESWA